VDSDFTQPGLGLNKEWRQQLISEVTIVFNMAASLRLEAGMKTAVCHNTTGTKQVLDFCLEMKQLKVNAFCIAWMIEDMGD
jgi:thioester reductase-like protein